MNWASKPKAAGGDEALLGDHTYRHAITAGPPTAGAGAGAGASAGASAGVAGAAAGPAAMELYPGQFLGLPPPPGFNATVGKPGGGPIRTDPKALRSHPAYYPSMNPTAMGARLSTT
jgi:hypothetical protein